MNFENTKNLIYDNLKNVINLSRLNNPLPILLLYIPCLWGLFFSYNRYISKMAMFNGALLFFIGAVAARSFGCIVNDIIDRKIDAQVERTKNRPLASGAVSVKYAVYVAIFWLIAGLIPFIIFNKTTKLVIIVGLLISVVYPFTKRFFSQPQIVLGMAFNIGAIAGNTAVYNFVSNGAFLIWIIGVYFTIFYDTIYAMQDVEYDEKLKLNSTAVKYKGKEAILLLKCVVMIGACLFLLGLLSRFHIGYYALLMILCYMMVDIIKQLVGKNYQKLFYKSIYVEIMLAFMILFERVVYN